MELRDYQVECIRTVERYGAGKWLCQLATGLGKTVIFANIPRSGRELILSHRQELVKQPLRYFDCSTSIEMGGDHADDSEVVSASIQTMTKRFNQYNPHEFDTVIVDEAHHAASPSYRKVLDYFKPRRILGFTATPNRGDGVGLEKVFNEIIFQKDLRFGIENGYLSPIQCKRVNIGYDLSRVSRTLGDYAPGELGRAVNVDGCNDAIADAVLEHSEYPVLIFAVDVQHAKDIAGTINAKAKKNIAKSLSAASVDREEVVESFKQGDLPVLVNCALFTEGTDLPNTRTVIIARPTLSNALYTQMVGRGTRLAPGKKHCLLIDCVGVSNQPLCTAPSLIGLDYDKVPKKNQDEIEGDLLADIPEKIVHLSDVPSSWIKSIEIVDLWAKKCHYRLHDVNYIKHSNGEMSLSFPVSKDSKRIVSIRISAPDLSGNATLITSGGYKITRPAQECFDLAYQCLRDRYNNARPLWDVKSIKRWGQVPAQEKQLNYIKLLSQQRKVDVSDVIGKLNKMQASLLISKLLSTQP